MDVAALGLEVDSSKLISGGKALDDFADKSDKAGKSTENLGRSNSRSMAAIESMARQLDKITSILSSIDKATTSSAMSIAQQGAAAEKATRMNATLGTATSKLTISYSQMAPAAVKAAAATESLAVADTALTNAASSATTATVALSKSQTAAAATAETANAASIGLSGTLAGLAKFAGLSSLAISLTSVSQAALAYSNAMREISTLVDTATTSMAQLEGVTLSQAQAFGTAPVDQAKALYEIISAGASDAAQATEILTAANKLAVGGVTEIQTAADGLTTVMASYGAAVGSATDVADAMFVAAAAGKTTIGELASSLGNVAPIASQLGVTFDELMAAVGALTKGGVATSTSMDGLRAVLAAVAKPSDEASKLADQLGISFNVAGIQAKGFGGFMDELVAKTGGSQEQLAVLFGGVEALVPVLALAGQAGKDFAANMETMGNKTGVTEAAFAKMMSGPGKQIDLLFSNISVRVLEAANALLDKLLPGITFLNQNFDAIVDILGAGAIAWGVYTAATIAGTVAQAAMSGVLGTIIGLVATTTAQFGILAGAQVAAAAATGGLSAAFNTLTAAMARNPIGIVAVALAALAAALFLARGRTDELSAAQVTQSRTSTALDSITTQLAKQQGVLATATGKAREEALLHVQALKAEAEKLLQVAQAASVAAAAKAFAAEQDARAAAKAPKGFLDLVTAGFMAGEGVDVVGDRTRRADAAATKAADAANKAGQEYRQATIRVGELQAQIEAATKPIQIASSATGGLGKSVKGVGDSARAAKKDVDEFATSLAEVAKALSQFQNESLGGLVEQMDKLDVAASDAFSRLLAEDNGKRTEWLTDAADASARWNDRLRETARLVNGLGQNIFGNGFGAISGPLNTLVSTPYFKIDPGSGKEIATSLGREFSDVLDGVFGGEGSFVKVLEGASTGASIGSLFGSSKANQIGGMIGGALGQEAGKALGASLGKLSGIAGPLGSILGGIAGSALGGLFKKDKYGTAVVGNGGINAFSGNSGSSQQGASSLAQSLQQTLGNLAKSLDVTLGQFAVSIGVTNGKINVNPGTISGMVGTTKQRDTIDFGEDQAGALKWAIQNAIEDGALQGLSEGWKKFLLYSDDIEGQFQKLSNLKSAYDELDAIKDPQGSALAALDKAFNALRETATRAGDDLAKVEELYGIKRKEILEKAANDNLEYERNAMQVRIERLQVEGKAEEALAHARYMQYEAADELTRLELKRLYAAQDAAEVAAKAKVIADERLQWEGRLLEANGDKLAQQQRELAAVSEANRAFAASVIAREGEIKAAEEAAAKALAIADERYGLETRLLTLMGDTAALQARELAKLDPSNHAMQERIWALEAAQDAEKNAADAANAARAAEDELARARQDQLSVLQDTIDKFRDFASSIRDFRIGLEVGGPGAAYATKRNDFLGLSRMAGFGDANALGGFVQSAQSFLDQSLRAASTAEQYERDRLLVASRSLIAERGADGVADMARTEYDALLRVDNTLQSTSEATRDEVAQLRADNKELAANNQALQERTIVLLNSIERMISRNEGPDGFRVTADDPIAVEVQGTVTANVSNVVAVDQVS